MDHRFYYLDSIVFGITIASLLPNYKNPVDRYDHGGCMPATVGGSPLHWRAVLFSLIMAAPQVPNLNSLRNQRGTGRGRGRGRGGLVSGLNIGEEKLANNRIVQQTDQDASVSRLSAVEVGYLDDPFAKHFVSEGKGQRRFPIINRGTSSCCINIDSTLTVACKEPMSVPKPLTIWSSISSTPILHRRSRSSP